MTKFALLLLIQTFPNFKILWSPFRHGGIAEPDKKVFHSNNEGMFRLAPKGASRNML